MPLEVLRREQAGERVLAFAPPVISEKSSERALKIGKALSARKAIMFGTYWCPFCNQERQALGRDLFSDSAGGSEKGKAAVRYVECDERGQSAQAALCSAVGVSSFPTWAVAVEASEGELPFELVEGALGLAGLERLLGLPVQPEEFPPILEASGPQELRAAEALAAQGAEVYGSCRCRYCNVQRQLLGREAWGKLRYVECDERCAGAQPAACEAKGVEAYPQWVFPGGQRIAGVLSLERVEDLLSELKSGAQKSGLAPGGATPPAAATVLPMPSGEGQCEDCQIQP